eukprot:1138717-Pelagomonas_calceolata.AAC.4
MREGYIVIITIWYPLKNAADQKHRGLQPDLAKKSLTHKLGLEKKCSVKTPGPRISWRTLSSSASTIVERDAQCLGPRFAQQLTNQSLIIVVERCSCSETQDEAHILFNCSDE